MTGTARYTTAAIVVAAPLKLAPEDPVVAGRRPAPAPPLRPSHHPLPADAPKLPDADRTQVEARRRRLTGPSRQPLGRASRVPAGRAHAEKL